MKLQPKATHSSKINRKGSILIVILWVISILTILAVSISVLTSSQIYFIKQYRNQITAYFIARAGIAQAIAELSRDKDLAPYDALNEEWSNKSELFYNKPVGKGCFSVGYEYSSGLKTEGGDGGTPITSTLCGMIDEERKININTASMSVLQTLFQEIAGLMPGQAKEIADSIIDWRDEDSERRENGAENEYYQSLPRSYSCKNKRFNLSEELILIKGMKPDIFYTVQDFITIYGDGKVNINTAPYPVLRALGLTQSLAERIIHCRASTDETEGTEDDGIFTRTNDIINILSKKGALSPPETSLINGLLTKNAITVKSNHFRIISEGYLADIESGEKDKKNNSKKITCITSRNGKILYWQE